MRTLDWDTLWISKELQDNAQKLKNTYINSLISIIILQGHTNFWNFPMNDILQLLPFNIDPSTPKWLNNIWQHIMNFIDTLHSIPRTFINLTIVMWSRALFALVLTCLSQNIFNKICIKINCTVRNRCFRRHRIEVVFISNV